jgi:hypothetical protein
MAKFEHFSTTNKLTKGHVTPAMESSTQLLGLLPSVSSMEPLPLEEEEEAIVPKKKKASRQVLHGGREGVRQTLFL